MRYKNTSLRWQTGCIVISLFFTLSLHAEQQNNQQPLPDPLSLKQALDLSMLTHPDLQIAFARLEKAYAQQAVQDSDQGIQVNLKIQPQWAKFTESGEKTGDSYANINITKKLYDFGYTRSLKRASESEIAHYKHQLRESLLQHRLNIIQAFYQVILADLRYTFDDEEMSQLYVKFDRMRERYQRGMLTEIKMLQAKNRYQEQLDIRTASGYQRQIARQQLALILNRPDQLPGEVIIPAISKPTLEMDDFKKLYAMLLNTNPRLKALRHKVKAMRNTLHAQKAQFNPTISAFIDINEYERSLSSSTDIRIGLQFNLPIYLGGKKQALGRMAYADFLTSRNQLRQLEYVLRGQLLELLSQLNVLKVSRQTANERVTLQDRTLDRQRALYELEIQANMGTALANITRAQLQATKVELNITLTLTQIDALLGKPFTTYPKENKP